MNKPESSSAKTTPTKRNRLRWGISAKITGMAWLISLLSLAVFALVMVPRQRQIFVDNLESKARSIAVSLQEVTAGAAISEDYSAVVDHCKQLLDGDHSIGFLIVNKVDGFGLVSDQSGWRNETLGAEWRPPLRKDQGGIADIPLFHRRVFFYSKPLDYSGIEWGWIHVGLSLESYDRSVTDIYRKTGFLAVGCVLFSLLLSAGFARQIVRPIDILEEASRKVGRGDMTARAVVQSGDEIERLAESFNAMTASLHQKGQILASVQFAAERFLSAVSWEGVMNDVLARIGSAAGTSRAAVFKRDADCSYIRSVRIRSEWVADGVKPTIEFPVFAQVSLDEEIGPIALRLDVGESVALLSRDATKGLRAFMDASGALSSLFIPIKVDGSCRGFLELDDCRVERAWTDVEKDSFQAAADMLGAAISRKWAQDALLEAKENLEMRVQERTRELEEQIHAKEQALEKLKDAQNSLMTLSRKAGMAEIAAGVLHNVGNVLNSVNVSANLVAERMNNSRTVSVSKVAALFQQHSADMGAFLTQDPKGRRIPEYLQSLSQHLEEERILVIKEVRELTKSVEHIKEIVAMQQNYARVGGLLEDLPVSDLIDDALVMNDTSLQKHGIIVKRNDGPDAVVRVDKHKVLQILINLLRNAKHAMDDPASPGKLLSISTRTNGDGLIDVVVRDSGVGIPPENITRIFQHGFTTKKDGHGFGLHSCAIAAREMGGSLQAESEGPGCGAVFTLKLPLAPPIS